jgi:hypothetical protein
MIFSNYAGKSAAASTHVQRHFRFADVKHMHPEFESEPTMLLF